MTGSKRGREEGGRNAKRMSLNQFARRVAELENVPVPKALVHVRAVFLTFRGAAASRSGST